MAQETFASPVEMLAAALQRVASELVRAARSRSETIPDNSAPPTERAQPVRQGWSDRLTWAKATYKARRVRDELFDQNLFAEPAWDMMLDLYSAHLEGNRISVSSACLASSVPPTTALRHIALLVEHGLVVKTECEKDGRRIYVELTEEATARMDTMFLKLRAMADRLPGSARPPD